ncbi:sigma-70 family RNA polymerase sigma factor [Amycolatopsis pigmentata]|uniref:RNA polymerase sigma factor n=1 Tax=Amycolatopsis pigmentata TaxID=450801 RepID=A0ABW5FMB2_9PSEU
MSVDRPSGRDITDWALAAGRGDPVALERFVRATQPMVWRLVAHLSDPGSADDLAQETFLRALGALHRFRAESSAVTWLLSIARRVAADQIRSARARPRHAEVTDWQRGVEQAQPITGPGFDEGVALSALLASLDAQRREAFVLTQTLGLSYDEAAQVCRCPVGTIRSRVFRARKDLLALLHDAEDPPRRRAAN